MPKIRVDIDYSIKDGTEIKFRSPVDCSQITGLIVYYLGANGNTVSKEFVLADAHGNNVGDINHLFAANVVVKVILDVTKGMAFVQNADTNAYLEAALAGKAPGGYGLGDVAPKTSISTTTQLANCRTCGFYRYAIKNSTICGVNFNYGSLLVYPIYTDGCVQEVRPMNSNACLRRYWYSNKWSEWELVGLVMKTLWYNASPTSNFAAQTISLDLSKYQAVYISSVRSTDDQSFSGSAFLPIDTKAYLMGTTDQFAVTRRQVTVTKTGVTFSGYSSSNNSNGNTNEIPIVIFGINGYSL